jgi:hypothetical protein
MGLTYYDAKRLWEARLAGVSFENTLTFGRLHSFLHPAELEALRRDYRSRFPGSELTPLENYRFGDFSDRFWVEFLDASSVQTLDYSGYEGATVVHDMNTPIPDKLCERFDAVIEAGSLEHVFQFPVAIRNLMLMAKTGGMVFLTTVANNLCGHGFYQFSPELMYRIFSPENGFETPRVVLLEGAYPWMELTPLRAAYSVADPARVGERVGLQSSHPVMMAVDAKKISSVQPFGVAPQQSDYVVAWERTAADGNRSDAGTLPRNAARQLLKRIFTALPLAWQQRIQGVRAKRQCSFRNTRFYRRLP